jgi:nucleotide-binding universal stress UspA family protein
VGVDGSPGSRRALRWAVEHARHHDVITPVTTYLPGPFGDGFGTNAGVDPTRHPYGDEALARLREFVAEFEPDLVDRCVVSEHRAGPGLVEAAQAGDLLVVGTRGRGLRADLSLGSVGSYCIKHSSVPVAVIPERLVAVQGPPDVVVGLDGTPNSRRALHWALTFADPSAEIVAVSALASSAGDDPDLPVGDDPSHFVGEVVDEVREIRGECPTVTTIVKIGDPRILLRDLSMRADMLVIGTHGHGRIAHLLMGSVAHALSHHPAVATVTVPSMVAAQPTR